MDPVFDFSADTSGGSVSRKRSRSSTPTPKAASHNTSNINGDDSRRDNSPSAASQALAARLLDPAQRNAAVNELLRASAVNYALDGDIVLEALAEVVFESLDWDQDVSGDGKPIFRPHQAWTVQPTQESKDWADHCERCFSNKGHMHMIDPEKLKCVEAVVVILRNLSFSAANVRLLAFSPDVLAILVGCLYEGSFFSSPSNLEDSGSSAAAGSSVLALPALHALVNIAPHLDVTGQKLFCDKLFFSPKNDDAPLMPDPSSFGQAADGVWGFGSLWLAKRLDAKEDVMTDIPKAFLLELTNASDFLVQVWSIFPALSYVFEDPKSPRALLMMAVELVQEFVNHARVGAATMEQELDDDIPNARSILINMPDVVLERLIDLLYVPRLGPDSLAYEDPTTNIVTRVNFLKLMMTYEANVDTDMRDRSLDVLVPLLEMDSPRMALRIGLNKKAMIRTRLYDALLPILAGNSGRSESSMLASQILKELAKAGDENKIGLGYIQGRLVEMASRDPRASQLALLHLYPTPSENKDADAPEEQVDQI